VVKRAAVLVPGGEYTVQAPLLAYVGEALERRSVIVERMTSPPSSSDSSTRLSGQLAEAYRPARDNMPELHWSSDPDREVIGGETGEVPLRLEPLTDQRVRVASPVSSSLGSGISRRAVYVTESGDRSRDANEPKPSASTGRPF
jgi:hypothetical protein